MKTIVMSRLELGTTTRAAKVTGTLPFFLRHHHCDQPHEQGNNLMSHFLDSGHVKGYKAHNIGMYIHIVEGMFGSHACKQAQNKRNK